MAADAAAAVLPLLIVVVAFVSAARFEQRIPTRLRIYRFHAIVYLGLMVLGLVLVHFMGLSPELDWWVDDALIYLALVFSISGTVLCLLLAPAVWLLERRSDTTRGWRVGRAAVSTATLVPYFFIVAIVVFYHE